MIYFISDFHFCHKNILNFERTQFKDIKEHDKFIIENYNSVVKENDKCWILGDFGGRDLGQGEWTNRLPEYFEQLNGTKYLLLGNHDSTKLVDFYASLKGVEEVYKFPVYIHNRIVLSHEPIKCNEDVINVHGHLHGSVLNLPNYICVSAHVINYKPIPITTIEKKWKKIPRLSSAYGEEWYYPFYQNVI